MKNIINKSVHLLIIALAHLLIDSSIFAQAPQKMSYQAVLRNGNDSLLVSTPVGMRISLVQSSPTGTVVYSETQTATTNTNGLVSLQIGMGTAVSGTFASIDWAAGPYYVKTETDITGGTNYTITSSNELLSVPYALFSSNGTPGPQGPQGIAGTNGDDGATGPQGPIGLTGPQGPQGIAGTNGNDGATGAQGPIGLTGPQGPAGNDGAVGATGATGPQGIAGTNGNNGATGPQGPQGIAGTNGNDGPTGPQGPQGISGTIGNDGATGPQGIAGTNGNDGATGAQGPIGLTGPQGPAGNYGAVGATGATGPQGIAGTNGNDGATGPQGPQGVAGTNGNDGATGATGPAGSFPPGTVAGEMNYWNGTAWVTVAPGISLPGNQALTLSLCNGVPTWGPCPAVLPTVTTTAVSDITAFSAIGSGMVTSDGGAALSAWGVCWSTSANPTLANSFLQNMVSSYSFSSSLNGLTANTIYYVRAYATNSVGTAYGNEQSFTTANYALLSIGQSYQGGIVAYILQPGDPGYDATIQHGLIAAPSNQSNGAPTPWGSLFLIGVYGTAIGTGAQNTLDIMNGCSEAGIAARLCGDLVLGGYSDWYLPSKDELNKLYINRIAIGGFNFDFYWNGSLTNNYYWSSTEFHWGMAWVQNFSNGYQYANSKENTFTCVRAVRAF